MDQLSAHLDRAWDLLWKGDFRGARTSARRALQVDADSPDAHNIVGQTWAREGDYDQALESYRTAMSLDDGYIDPMLNAAEVLIHPLGRFDEAIALCDEVLEFAEYPDEIADTLLLKFDALLSRGDKELARKVLDALPEGPFEGNHYTFLMGRAWFEAGEPERAEPLLTDAVNLDGDNGDAWYYLGLAREHAKDWKGATLAFLEARESTMREPAAPWSLPKDQFQRTVEQALGTVTGDMLRALDGALVLVNDVPGVEMVCDGIDPRIGVLIEGILPPDVEGPKSGRTLVRVFVYQRNIEHACAAVEELEDEIVHQLDLEFRFLSEGAPSRSDEASPRVKTPPQRPLTPAPAPAASAAPPAEPAPAPARKKPRKKGS